MRSCSPAYANTRAIRATFWEDAHDISDKSTLVELVEDAAIDADEIRSMLSDESLRGELQE